MRNPLPHGAGSRSLADFTQPITMAFQPVVDRERDAIFAYEALVRGCDGSGALDVLGQVLDDQLHAFDQRCRVTAIDLAARLRMDTLLSINFMPHAVLDAERCLQATLAAVDRAHWPLSRLMFEVTEHEQVAELAHVMDILKTYRGLGMKTAIDDFGAGFSGLNLLAEFQPDYVKFDRGLVRGLDTHRTRRKILAHAARLCAELEIQVIAEGVETPDEAAALLDLGVSLQQGYLYARPMFEGLPVPAWPGTSLALSV